MTNEFFDLNTANEQKSFDVIPARTVVTLHMTIRPGGTGPDGWLTRAADGNSEGLDCEFTVVGGDYDRRKLWQRFTVEGTTKGHVEAKEISRKFLRAAWESARGIRPDDKSEAANAARKVNGYGEFEGLRFIARLGVEPPKGNFPAKNFIIESVTPERTNWSKPEQLNTQTAGAPSAAPAAPATPPANAIARPEWGRS
jgi:hypothetical protein